MSALLAAQIGAAVGVLLLVGMAAYGVFLLGRAQGVKQGLEDRCEHVWETTSVTRYGPGGSASGFVDESTRSRILYGCTVVGERCTARCGTVRSRVLRGLVKVPGWA